MQYNYYEDFKEDINLLYKKINTGVDNESFQREIEKISTFSPEENGSLSYTYNALLKDKKSKGTIYTPEEISMYILKNTIIKEDIIKNPFIKICDPSCGAGNILISIYKYLYNLFCENLSEINKQNNINLKISNLPKHIIKNNIYGYDVDELALKIAQIELFRISNILSENLSKKDFLLDNKYEKYDFFIGNPPYIGHKIVGKEYFNVVKEKYKNIYDSKADLSYCFFIEALNYLNYNGKIGFITSRYFLEACSANKLRKYLVSKASIDKIVDYYGLRPFKNIGVDPLIIFLSKEHKENEIQVIKPKNICQKESYKLLEENPKECYKFYVDSTFLEEDNWLLVEPMERKIIKKIENATSLCLKDICKSHQGIITGCDKAFIVNNTEIKDFDLENKIIKPWIKSSNIKNNLVEKNSKYLIYSNDIEKEEGYPNTIKYIGEYKEKLCKRRECVKGYRKWYELQWGRKSEIFQGEKIVFPYKAEKNKFVLDKGSYFSADVYALEIIDEKKVTYEFLTYVLNTKLYNIYFKAIGKKLGGELYEYYPNTVMNLKIPSVNDFCEYTIEKLYDYFDFNKEEIEYINKK